MTLFFIAWLLVAHVSLAAAIVRCRSIAAADRRVEPSAEQRRQEEKS